MIRRNEMRPCIQRMLELAEAKGMTRVDIARAADIPPTTLSNYVTRGGEPGYDVLEKIAKALGVTIGYLKTGAEPSQNLTATLRDLGERISVLPEEKQDSILKSFYSILAMMEA